ncbi:hypothetical protein JCM6882_001162 [Rhodosporidiobolus microsporus]
MAALFAGASTEEDVPDVLVQVLEILEDTHDDLSACGPAVLSLLGRTFTLLNSAFDHPPPSTRSASLAQAATLSSSLLHLSDEKLNSFPYKDVPLCWRRLYTDAILLGALAELAMLPHTGGAIEEKKRLEEVVRQLDMALIIAGAPGEGRDELVFALMQVAQERLRAVASSEERAPSPPPSKKRRLSPPSTSAAPLPPPFLARPLPSLRFLPDFLTLPSTPVQPFDPLYPHSSPFIVRKAASAETGWSSVERWKNLEYLRDKVGPGRVVPVEVGGDYTQAGWGQKVMPFEEFLDSLPPSPTLPTPDSAVSPSPDPSTPVYYLAQHSLFRQFPSLLSDLAIPDIVYSAPSSDGAGGAYEGVKTPDGYIINAWFGPGGTKSAAHTDPWWNCYVQVTGSKWVWVAPPSCSSSMAAFGASSPSPPSPSSTVDNPSTNASETAEQYMSNTSSLDVSVPPPSSSSSPTSAAHPPVLSTTPRETKGYYPQEWLDKVEPLARQVVLEAGDVLVMPPGWWHAMQSLETSFSVSIWF